ncbi:MAG: nitrite reductase large subunit NirB [Pseudomonadota bacterium]
MSKQRIVVVGNGMVGHHYVETLANTDLNVAITVIGGEPHPAYDRVHLSAVFDGKSPEDLAMTTREHYGKLNVNAHFGDFVTVIDRDNKRVITEGGQSFVYDTLVLATGSYPFIPPIPGHDQDHCLAYRTIDDLAEIKASAQGVKKAVVVGGGLLGLECANALKNLGLQTHVVEFAPGLMGVQLDEGGSKILRRKIEGLGVYVHTSKATTQIIKGENHRLRMEFADDTYLETDMIVFSAGIRPYDQLAKEAGLQIGERGGIAIDDCCRSSDPDIYAIGECAALNNFIYGLAAPGYRMAEAAVSQLSQDKVFFSGADMSTRLKLLGVDVGSIGDAHARGETAQRYSYCDDNAQVYKSITVSADNKKLLGAVLVGDCSDYDTLLQYMLNALDLPDSPEAFILPGVDREVAVGLDADALPDAATVCSCYAVSKGDLCSSIQNGATTMDAIKQVTQASTGCGGCTALTKQLLDRELAKLGTEVNTEDNNLCEHFAYNRQELTEIIREKKITRFDTLLESHGKGHGCELCKSTIGSILASCWSKYVLKYESIGSLHTNDSNLGHRQEDGTYSVVPRVANGEITPEKLIVLGEVAKEFDLYTEITDGQDIDLFGAQRHELPAIWRKLINAGFEVDHACGKSVRSLECCVSDGVDNSVDLARYIEDRYKGLHSTHKLLFAVSSGSRECAQAQTKDLNLIATETGWDLYIRYVCGSDGIHPHYGDLIAGGLDDATLIQYVDRFLLFYIQTSDRLQNMSQWLDNLKGGLAYLKQVIINDKPGIGETLDAEMASIIAAYPLECEARIKDKGKRVRDHLAVDEEAIDAIKLVG